MVYDINSIFFFKQKTAYEMRISDWSSDVCSSDLPSRSSAERGRFSKYALATIIGFQQGLDRCDMLDPQILRIGKSDHQFHRKAGEIKIAAQPAFRSEEHTSELQSLMRISYSSFGLTKKKKYTQT